MILSLTFLSHSALGREAVEPFQGQSFSRVLVHGRSSKVSNNFGLSDARGSSKACVLGDALL